MFRQYERESGQMIEQDVIARIFEMTQGQPGLIGWFGEILTEKYNKETDKPITMTYFERVYNAALHVLPNNNILNLISKALQKPYKHTILELFRTDKRMLFSYDDEILNFLYMNGVVDWEEDEMFKYYARFPSPFVQQRLFNAFSRDIFPHIGQLCDPFDDLGDTITDDSLNIKNLMRRYETYLRKNRDWLLRDAPRRKTDGRIHEAAYHFNLYMYLQDFLQAYQSRIHPEFPTGNGKIDILIRHAGQRYGLEVKSFSGQKAFRNALKQAACYGRQLGLKQISLILFTEHITDENRTAYEAPCQDSDTDVTVNPVFVVIS